VAGETNIGGIVGFLRLENDQFVRAIDQAIYKTEILDGKRVDIRVDADTSGAAAGLERTAIQADRLDGSVKRVNASSRSARGGVGALATAVIALGPAMVPLAAGAVGLGAAFGGMGAAGVAALVGVMQEMKAGTVVGESYRATLGSAKADLEGLASTAAGNILGSFQDAVRDLNEQMPALNAQVGDLATISGRAGAALVGGVVTGFQVLNPLMLDASVYVLDLMQRFQAAAGGSGMTAFVDYVRSVFPTVMQDIESIVGAVAHLVAALAPLGGGTLSALRTFADLISSIPTDVLSVVAQLATSVFIGFKSWQALSTPISGLIGMLGGVESMSTRAAMAVRGLQMAAGLIGVAIAGLSLLFAANAEDQRKAEDATNRYADALRASNGVIDESIRQSTAKALADEGVLEAGRKLGVNLADLTDAALGNADAQARVNAVIGAQKDVLTEANSGAKTGVARKTELGEAADKVTKAIGFENNALHDGIQKNRDLAAATASTAGATSNAEIAARNLATTYGVSSTTYSNVAAGQQKIADKAAEATLKMQLENDAAGLLKQQLDLLAGKSLSAAQAQNSFDRAQLSLAGPIKAAKEALAAAEKRAGEVAADSGKKSAGGAAAVRRAQLSLAQAQDHLRLVQSNGKATASQLASAQDRVERATLNLSIAQGKAATTTGAATQAQKDAANAAAAQARANLEAMYALEGSSEAAVTNRANLLGLVQAAEQSAEAEGNRTGSSEKGRLKLIELRAEILKNAEANGFSRKKVEEFIDSVLKIPKSVPPTKVDLDTAAALKKKAALQAAINAITGKTVTVTLQQVYTTLGQPAALRVHNEQRLSENGVNTEFARGGIISAGVRKMAQGDISRPSMIMRSTRPILWNEAPGGEAFISLAPQQRARSLAIHSEVGKILGAGGGAGGGMTYEQMRTLAGLLGREFRRLPAPSVDMDGLSSRLVGGM
jgi:hypothetical protein